jgi:Flavodoxin domain
MPPGICDWHKRWIARLQQFIIAVRVAEVLRTQGTAVDVKPVAMVHELQGYKAVVVGSAIRMGHWLPEAVEFVKANREALSRIPTAYFVVSGLLRNDTPEVRRHVLAFLDPVRALLEPVRIGLFAGSLDQERVSTSQSCHRDKKLAHSCISFLILLSRPECAASGAQTRRRSGRPIRVVHPAP